MAIELEIYHRNVDALILWCKQYYLYPNHGECEVSDPIYDEIYRSTEEFEKLHPDLVRSDSPIGKVAGGISFEV